SLSEMQMSYVLFRITLLGALLDVDLMEFATWSLMTELMVFLKSLALVCILRSKMVPGVDIEYHNPSYYKMLLYTWVLLFVNVFSFAIITSVIRISLDIAGWKPLILLLFDAVAVCGDTFHGLSLITINLGTRNNKKWAKNTFRLFYTFFFF
ncbi:hypothetical protein RFI_35976, partial [Reticulomyxa filosa]